MLKLVWRRRWWCEMKRKKIVFKHLNGEKKVSKITNCVLKRRKKNKFYSRNYRSENASIFACLHTSKAMICLDANQEYFLCMRIEIKAKCTQIICTLILCTQWSMRVRMRSWIGMGLVYEWSTGVWAPASTNPWKFNCYVSIQCSLVAVYDLALKQPCTGVGHKIIYRVCHFHLWNKLWIEEAANSVKTLMGGHTPRPISFSYLSISLFMVWHFKMTKFMLMKLMVSSGKNDVFPF